MKFSHFLSFATSACLSISVALAAPLHGDLNSHLQSRNVLPLASLVHAPATFYRAVYKADAERITTHYQLGKHPGTARVIESDFSPTGAIYVFTDREQAIEWGNAWQKTWHKSPFWYLVTFKYTPVPGTRIKSFLSGTPEWKNFVEGNYKENAPHPPYDVIEGPVSIIKDGATQPHVDPVSKKMLYQAAFLNAGLKTLVVQNIEKKSVSTGLTSWCENCHLM